MDDFFSTGNEAVDALRKINFTGNIIPAYWYKTIIRENGKPNLIAINILADIVYWYRPSEKRDETTGAIIGYTKKFRSDKLQRSYSQIADQFGISKRQAVDAIIFLEKLGVVQREFRNIKINGQYMNNVLFVGLNPNKLYEITFEQPQHESMSHSNVTPLSIERDPSPVRTGQVPRSNVTPLPLERETNTEIITEITEEISTESCCSCYVPDIEDIKKYINDNNYTFDAKHFYDYYNARNWCLGNVPIANFEALKSLMNNWQLIERKRETTEKAPTSMQPPKGVFNNYNQHIYSEDEINAILRRKNQKNNA